MKVLRVEEVAQILDQHVKTVRRHIREGRLPAVKIGGEWRVPEAGLEAFLQAHRGELRAKLSADVADFAGGVPGAAAGGPDEDGLQACVVLRYRRGDPERAAAILHICLDAMNADDPNRGAARFHAVQDAEEALGTYALWGRPAFLAKVLARIDEAERGPGQPA